MENKEIRKLVHDLANALLDLTCKLEEADDMFVEGKYNKEMEIYDRATEWLKEQNKG